jgi:hypothetical protein
MIKLGLILAAVPRWAAVALAVIAAACLAVLVAVQANAFTHASGPAESPGGTYFLQGQIVNFCFTHRSGGWLEFNTTALGNCPPGDVQLSVWADPSGLEPVTATPSP